jgi:hypothetical protein
MAFSEKTKEEAKYSSRYMCIFCKQFGTLDVHHIIPQKVGGPDTIDNAICLCPTHHRKFGDKPEFIDYLREERSKWYLYCKKFLPDGDSIKQKFEDLERQVIEVKKIVESRKNNEIDTMKGLMIKTYDDIITKVTQAKEELEKDKITLSDIAKISVSTSGATVTSGMINTVAISSVEPSVISDGEYSPFKTERKFFACPNCGYLYTNSWPIRCNKCGMPMEDY